VDGTEADVAPQPVSERQVTAAPRKLQESAMNKTTTETIEPQQAPRFTAQNSVGQRCELPQGQGGVHASGPCEWISPRINEG
jgi:hypothetical protein